MKPEMFDKIAASATPNFQTFENDRGAKYVFSDKNFKLIANNQERPARITVSTLQAIVDLYSLDFEKIKEAAPVAVINSPTSVDVISSQSDNSYQRTTFIAATAPEGDRAFTFNQFVPQETFIIGLNSCFQDGGDRAYVASVISTLATKDGLEVADNGITQTATAKAGVSLVAEVELKPRVKLTPWRTFREADQPESEFLLRVKKGSDGMPLVALFEADGGRWKVDAVRYVAAWLTTNLPKNEDGTSGMLVVS